MKSYGTPEVPIRCAAIPTLIRCPARVILEVLEMTPRTSGKAADTGTAAHYAVSQFHMGATAKEAVAAMKLAAADFPFADIEEAQSLFTAYSEDTRNQVPVAYVEKKVYLTLDPHPWDSTGTPIHVEGTTDQVRLESGVYRVWDYKTGSPGGWEMLHDYAYQLAAYTLATRQTLGIDAHPGGIIRGRGYFNRGTRRPETSPDGVFFPCPMSVDQCIMMMERLKLVVAGIRAGAPMYGPGDHCRYCPHGGLGQCLELGHRRGLKVI